MSVAPLYNILETCPITGHRMLQSGVNHTVERQCMSGQKKKKNHPQRMVLTAGDWEGTNVTFFSGMKRKQLLHTTSQMAQVGTMQTQYRELLEAPWAGLRTNPFPSWKSAPGHSSI